ncbi:MAG TPA: cupin domain-containing protein [Vicinamibacterales bacterium]|jgi:quercetin dioxygenase-like cupin family protein|nr:cupin domain-containing protein [Vicinamibacterales bacterium]
MFSVRQFTAVTIAVFATGVWVGVAASKQVGSSVMRSAIFQWESVSPTPTNVGAVRRFFRTPTATLDELEFHVTTLNPGQSSHAPHQHPNEELIIVKEGAVEAFSNGAWKPVSTGSIIFNASNELHAVRNPGATPVTYFVINWSPPGMLKPKAD